MYLEKGSLFRWMCLCCSFIKKIQISFFFFASCNLDRAWKKYIRCAAKWWWRWWTEHKAKNWDVNGYEKKKFILLFGILLLTRNGRSNFKYVHNTCVCTYIYTSTASELAAWHARHIKYCFVFICADIR